MEHEFKTTYKGVEYEVHCESGQHFEILTDFDGLGNDYIEAEDIDDDAYSFFEDAVYDHIREYNAAIVAGSDTGETRGNYFGNLNLQR